MDWACKFECAGSEVTEAAFKLARQYHRLTGNPGKYKVIDLPYYEPDTPAKWRAISQQLAGADYIAFQTKRLYGALTMAPEKYPSLSA